MLQPRKLILHSLMVDPKLRQRPTEFFGLRLHPRHFADQVANHADQIGMRRRSNESGGGRVIHSLNHTFQTLTPPPPGNLPRLHMYPSYLYAARILVFTQYIE